MNVLVLDIGGTNVKLWRTGAVAKIKFPSGRTLTPERLFDEIEQRLGNRPFDRVSIGYPGEVVHGRPVKDPYNLGPGWLEFDFQQKFNCPVRLMNDASMQALGSYDGGRMLYLGLGTSVGTVFVSDGRIVPLALGHMLLDKRRTFEQALSREGLDRRGTRRWVEAVAAAAKILKYAFLADYVMLGGGNAKKIKVLPEFCRRGGNFNAYIGGLRMWDDALHLDDFSGDRTRELEHELRMTRASM
jgi:predicted NBD/HSP70 family sugar kinase